MSEIVTVNLPIPEIPFKTIESVYSSNKPDACMCGCCGKYTYTAVNRKRSGKERGYDVSKNEVNDRVVKGLLTKMKRSTTHTFLESHKNNIYTVYIGGRQYTLYQFKDVK